MCINKWTVRRGHFLPPQFTPHIFLAMDHGTCLFAFLGCLPPQPSSSIPHPSPIPLLIVHHSFQRPAQKSPPLLPFFPKLTYSFLSDLHICCVCVYIYTHPFTIAFVTLSSWVTHLPPLSSLSLYTLSPAQNLAHKK